MSLRTPGSWCYRPSAVSGTRHSGRAGQEAMSGGTIYVRCPYLLTDYFGLIVSSVGETIELHGGQMILTAGEGAANQKWTVS
jgi:hypothetical protein